MTSAFVQWPFIVVVLMNVSVYVLTYISVYMHLIQLCMQVSVSTRPAPWSLSMISSSPSFVAGLIAINCALLVTVLAVIRRRSAVAGSNMVSQLCMHALLFGGVGSAYWSVTMLDTMHEKIPSCSRCIVCTSTGKTLTFCCAACAPNSNIRHHLKRGFKRPCPTQHVVARPLGFLKHNTLYLELFAVSSVAVLPHKESVSRMSRTPPGFARGINV
jgi:hypothetical protein